MSRGGKVAIAVLLMASGLALAAFFGLLLAIADCGSGCVSAGERAVPVGLIGLGAGLVTAGATLLRLTVKRAIGWGIAVAGLVSALGCIVLFAEGSRGMAYGICAAGLAAIFVGGTLRRRD